MKKSLFLTLVLSAAVCCAVSAQTRTTSLKIDVKDTEPLSPWVFGHNLEHTRAAVNRGISAQMLQNRKFAGMTSRNEGIADHWFGIGGGDAFFTMDDHTSYTRHDGLFDMHRSHELQAQNVQNLCAGTPVGIGQQEIALVQGKEYEFRTVTRVSVPTTLTVSLTDRKGTTIYASHELRLSPGEEWQEKSFVMSSAADDMEGCVRYTFTEASDVLFGALSMMPTDNFHGMRPDVVANLKAIGPAVLRWPGGNFAGEYRWMDGLLPSDMRGPLQAAMEMETQPYSNGYDYHEINTDDFIALCREVGAEPFLTINAVWNTPEESAAWVEYCNGGSDTEYGRIRIERGFEDPYDVRLWSLGNEMGYGHMEGPKGASAYAGMVGVHADAMLKVSPGLELWSSGPYPNDDWAMNSAAVLSDRAGYVSLHNYSVPEFAYTGAGYHYTTPEATERTYKMMMDGCMGNLDVARRMRESLDATGKRMHISFDEWNQWFSWYRPSCVSEAMFCARMLHVFMMESNDLDMPMVCYFQPVGEGAIAITPTDSRLTANGQVFAMMKDHCGGALCRIDGDDDYRAVATVKDGVLTVTLVNTEYSEERAFRFNARGKVISSRLLSSEDVRPNTFFAESPLEVIMKRGAAEVILPPHSVAGIRIQLP